MHLQTTSSVSEFPYEYTDVIFIQIYQHLIVSDIAIFVLKRDVKLQLTNYQHLKKLLPKYKGVPIL